MNVSAMYPTADVRFAVRYVCLFVFGLLWPLSQVALPAENRLGLVAARPSKTRSVETSQGFMVPYTQQIPGTAVSFQMVPIPGGKIKIGSPATEPGRQPTEGPQFEVTVPPFWMARCEVNWAEYKEYMKLYGIFKEFDSRQLRAVTPMNRADAVTAPTELYDPSFTFTYGEDPQQPAVTMTQFAARQYTKWLAGVTTHQYRLPSNAEWEYACRAGASTAYHFGDAPDRLGEYAWYFDNADEHPQHVGLKKPNRWGLHDMHGNVWEWVIDEFLEDGYQRFGGKSLTLAEAVVWPTRAYPRMVCGGSWEEDAIACRSASRLGSHDVNWKQEDPNLPLSPWWFTSDPARGVGFRVVRSLVELPRQTIIRYWEARVEDVKEDVQIRLDEGRGVLGLVDPELPAAIRKLDPSNSK